jgi:hypothetical protein
MNKASYTTVVIKDIRYKYMMMLQEIFFCDTSLRHQVHEFGEPCFTTTRTLSTDQIHDDSIPHHHFLLLPHHPLVIVEMNVYYYH